MRHLISGGLVNISSYNQLEWRTHANYICPNGSVRTDWILLFTASIFGVTVLGIPV
jgi:hypothetical protein